MNQLIYVGNLSDLKLFSFEIINGYPTGVGWEWDSRKGWIRCDGIFIFQELGSNPNCIEIGDFVCNFLDHLENK